jgi:hypothetical protein
MKKLLLTVAFIMVIMSFGFAAYAADWPQFQKDAKNSGIYDSGTALPITLPTKTSVLTEAGGFFGIDSCPIYVTTGDTGYAYVFPSKNLFEYGVSSSGLQLNDSLQLVNPGGFQLSTPASDGSSIYVATNDMFNQIQNKDFTEGADGFAHWATQGSPVFSTTTVDSKTCAKLYEASNIGERSGSLVQTGVSIPSPSTVRLAFAYKYEHTGSAPTQGITVEVKPTTGSTWVEIYPAGTDYYDDGWYYVNFNVTDPAAFPAAGNYDIRFTWNYDIGAGSTATCYFSDCQLIAQSFGVKKITGLGSGTLSLVPGFGGGLGVKKGQSNNPVKYYSDGTDEYLVVGQYGGSNYFCLNPANGDLKWTFDVTGTGGYYWAGAALANGVAIFGDDNGCVHVVPLDQTGSAAEVDQDPATPGVQPYDLEPERGPVSVRSSVCYYDVPGSNIDKLYLTARSKSYGQFGYIYELDYNASTRQIVDKTPRDPDSNGNGGYSTSTPCRYDNYVFFGANGGLYVCEITGGVMGVPNRVADNTGGIQASPVVQKLNNKYYIYATRNIQGGKAFCAEYDPAASPKGSLRWETTAQNFTLQGFAAADGKLFFGDDAGYLYYLH